jgi:amino acid transporter
MRLEDWFALPTPDWGGTLVGLALALISAGAAVYTSVVVPWTSELESAVAGTVGPDGLVRKPTTGEGARALQHLTEVRHRDPAKGLGVLALIVTTLMTVLGVLGGLQIQSVGWLYTVVPVLVATTVAGVAVVVPGRASRRLADRRLIELGG